MGNVTTTYIGNHFEWRSTIGNMTRYYYYAGGQCVAMRQGGVLMVLHSDHGYAQHGLQHLPRHQRQWGESEREASHRYRARRLAFMPVYLEETVAGFSARASQKRGTG